MQNKIMEFFQNKNITILGFGIEGRSTYNFIRKHNKDMFLTIRDLSLVEDLNDSNLEIISGESYLDNLEKHDLIIKTPGISLKDIDITNIEDKIISQLELLLMFDAYNVIGVTGTKGKSTTSTLIYNTLKTQRESVVLAGNIGIPVFDILDEIKDDTVVVVEMSSHQLEFLNVSPHVAVILNLYEDHLDHAGSVKHYHESKMKIFDYQKDSDVAIYCSDNEYLKEVMSKKDYHQRIFKVQYEYDKDTVSLKDNKVYYEDEVIYVDDGKRKLLGDHNLKNIMVVMLVAKLFRLDLDKAKKDVDSFTGLENRLEYVDTVNGIKFYSDTIATIPEATISGIEALGDVDTLIFGGMDRGINYQPLIDFLATSKISNLICMPSTGVKIGEILKDKTDKNIIFVDTLEEAVTNAKKITKKDMSCLLSPAAPSYEYFKNFMEKGNKYKELVK